MANAQQLQMIKAFGEWGAKKYGKGLMTGDQFLQLFLLLDEQSLKLLIQEFLQDTQAPMARLGAKLNYIKQIKGACPEGQELVYFKKGGRFCKACQDKKLKGGTMSSDPVADFKKARAEKCGGKTKKMN